MTRCSYCGGAYIPSAFKDEPDVCMLCGRDGRPTITPEQAAEMRKQELGGLGRRLRREWFDAPARKGRPKRVVEA